MWKFSIDIAERNGALLRRRLRSAERLSESATARGVRLVNTPRSRSSALLVRMTLADQRLPRFAISGAVQCLCLEFGDGARTSCDVPIGCLCSFGLSLRDW
jgi:hypothetical protein